jgi:hypothetical protein
MEVIGDFGYEPIADAQLDRFLYHSVKFSERLACADLAVQVVDSASLSDQYAMGAVRAAFVPCVSLTANAELEADEHVPSDYWPRFIASDDAGLARLELSRQLTLYEQAFVELETPAAVTQYVNLLIRVSNPIAAYDQEVRGLFVRELHVGDQYNVNQAAAVGPQAHAHDITFQQLWTRSADKIDLEALALDLGRLRSQLKAEANNATEDAAVGQIALAETAAKEKNGPGVLAHLKAAGQWALSVAEKIGVAVATGAIKTALGL